MHVQRRIERHQLPYYLKVFNRITDKPMGYIGNVSLDRPAGRGGERGGEVWGEGYFPNIELTTHRGERVRFFDDLIAGKVVAINFIYTWCPDTCPVETARMLQVARLLGDRLGDDVHFYSITIDPEHDTQEVLAEFAATWGIPEGWTFLTGDERDIIRLRKKLGMRLDDVRSGDISEHTVSLLIGNQTTGRWMKRSPFENPYVLANQLGSWLHGWKLASAQELDYADAPEIRQISDGEYLFRNRCAACHTIGGGDLRNAARQHIGPDLLDVGQVRDRDWLERWIAEPDAMIEEGDPLALELRRPRALWRRRGSRHGDAQH
jgi:protein SCO1/2